MLAAAGQHICIGAGLPEGSDAACKLRKQQTVATHSPGNGQLVGKRTVREEYEHDLQLQRSLEVRLRDMRRRQEATKSREYKKKPKSTSLRLDQVVAKTIACDASGCSRHNARNETIVSSSRLRIHARAHVR